MLDSFKPLPLIEVVKRWSYKHDLTDLHVKDREEFQKFLAENGCEMINAKDLATMTNGYVTLQTVGGLKIIENQLIPEGEFWVMVDGQLTEKVKFRS